MKRPGFSLAHAAPRMLVLAGLCLVTACGSGEKDESLASLDARLTNSMADPGNAGQGGEAVNGAAAAADGPAASAPRNALAGDGTLGALAEQQGRQREQGSAVERLRVATGGNAGAGAGAGEIDECGRHIVYGDRWASDMPAPFSLYPGATLVEAAGVTTDRCRLRVMTFTTSASSLEVARHYMARAREAGFNAERRPCEGGQMVGGVRAADGTAYILFLTSRPDGSTAVDIIATLA